MNDVGGVALPQPRPQCAGAGQRARDQRLAPVPVPILLRQQRRGGAGPVTLASGPAPRSTGRKAGLAATDADGAEQHEDQGCRRQQAVGGHDRDGKVPLRGHGAAARGR